MKLSYYINFILKLENASPLTDVQALNIDGFDVAILMLDDIKDHSKIREGKPCFYLVHGIDKTKKEAKILQSKAFQVLNSICDQRKLGFVSKIHAQLLLYRLHSVIKHGQRIDSYLEYQQKIQISLISKYDTMVKLFTGGHVKYGFSLGYLLSGKNPEYRDVVIYIGERIGIIRQIIDDINDYKQEHHEPLGDLINRKKRIPELMFFLNSSIEEQQRLKGLLHNSEENILEITELVLSKKNKDLIEEKIQKINQEIILKLARVPQSYNVALGELLYKFLHEK
jgi:geranylgeranyl pyrophosphate synthase